MKEHLEQIQVVANYISKKYPETTEDMVEILRLSQLGLDEIYRNSQVKKDKKKLAAMRANKVLGEQVWNQLKKE